MQGRFALWSIAFSISALLSSQRVSATEVAPGLHGEQVQVTGSGYVLASFLADDSPALVVPAPGSPIAIAGGASHIALGDVNQDGIPDLAVASARGSSITILIGLGDGQFGVSPVGPVKLPEMPNEMVLQDINGDGKLDLAIASHGSYGVMLLLGDGDGGFAVAPNSPILMKDGERPHTHGLTVGDVNSDGRLDLVTVNSDPDDNVSVVLDDGQRGYVRVPGSPFAVGPSPYPAALHDINGDGHLDIVNTTTDRRRAAQGASRALTLLIGDGSGDFRPSQIPLRTANPWFVAVSDVNGDLSPDLLATHAERNELTVLLGDGSGHFTETAGSPFNLGHPAWHMAAVDVNADGMPDAVAAADDGIRVMLGDGHGSFQPAPGSPFATGKGAWRLAVGDLNGDGKPDVATSNIESDSVTVLLGS